MDRILTDIRRNHEKAAKTAPHPVEISIVPPEHPPTDEPMPPKSMRSRTEAEAGNKTASDAALEVGLLSRQTTAAVDSAFNALAHALRKQNSQTLEELVRETLQPRLKSWLDDNLPGLVERMVRAEIELVSREH
jgi:cell pole-organizing protein PopZ